MLKYPSYPHEVLLEYPFGPS
uniref:Uncharacterized protein n=1 Tax=Arundo donax TaxID=35708 RepID=A0A0A9ACD3_ARUDO